MQTGIWIDTKKALIVHLKEKERQIITVESHIEGRTRVKGESRQTGRFGDQYLSPEKSRQNRQLKLYKDFFQNISKKIMKSEFVVLFGPAQTKYDLEKHLQKDNSFTGKIIGVESADSMTQNQIAAWVKGFYE